MIYIIVPTFNRIEDTKNFLDSINNYIPNSSNYSKRILVTDINVHKKNDLL